jgi:FADH2-dependent halogenase
MAAVPEDDRSSVVVVGGGPAGSVVAACLAARGIPTTVLEHETFPRFHIGESLTGECGALLRRLGLEDQMDAAGHPVKWGVSVFGSGGRNRFWVPVMQVTEDGGRAEASTWQVRRSEFDRQLLDHARSLGADVRDGTAIAPLSGGDGRVRGVRAEVDGATVDLAAEFVVDASGSRCFLARAGVAGRKTPGPYVRQVAIFTHVLGATRDDGPAGGNTLIFYDRPDHWAWFIPIDAEVVSVGVVVPAAYYTAADESPADFLGRQLLELNPALAERTGGATFVMDPHVKANYSYRVDPFAGPGWICVGDSHRFTDPIFSFGVHLASHEAERAAATIAAELAAPSANGRALAEYAAWCEGGQDTVAALIDSFWSHPLAFGWLLQDRHRDELIDLFAGRVYDVPDPAPGLAALKRLAAADATD